MRAHQLHQRSIDIILNNQSPGGAYIASPNFPTYHYCWFRDGTFIAYAMDLVGQHASAARFHGWAAAAIRARAEVVQRAIRKVQQGATLDGADILHTRYTLDGQNDTADSHWPNFQLDGFGTWLWGLGEHHRLTNAPLPVEWQQAADLVAAYLTALWWRPCYDCWEEFPDHVHPHTLVAVYGGLQAHGRVRGRQHAATLSAIQAFLDEQAVLQGHFVKFIGSAEVDSSLLGLAVPYGVVAAEELRMRATVERIEGELRRGGGVHRYAADTYYGGGEWVLLTAWLGWYYARVGERGKAQAMLSWVESQADAHGQLPEQIPATLNDPACLEPWRARWGDIANPLLWSHAKYLILLSALEVADRGAP